MTNSFEFTLHSPLTEDDLVGICDYEHEHSNSVTFQTPKGKQVKYIKADVLNEIRAEIEEVKAIMCDEIIKNNRKDLINFVNGLNQSLCIIDKYSQEDMA